MNQRRFSDPVEEQDIAASTDRRDGDRYRTVWRIAKVMRNGDAGLWRLRHLSHPGMMASAALPIALGEKLVHAISESGAVPCEVQWARTARYSAIRASSVSLRVLLVVPRTFEKKTQEPT